MKLIIQPDDGLKPLLTAISKARTAIDIVIFRFDCREIEEALAAAVERKVVVRALIAHTNRGGERMLRRLETRMLAAGIMVARTSDDLPRYHGKMMIVDDTLFVLGFNYTKLDIQKSRSLGISTREPGIVREASALFEADSTRQPYGAGHDRLVVSPESSRELLSAFIRGAKRQLLIYDAAVTDNAVQRLLLGRARAGVEIRILGKLEKPLDAVAVRKLKDRRMHVRAMVRDGKSAFVGSQSLRRLELDGRREIGLIVNNTGIAKKIQAVFEADWEEALEVKPAAPANDVAAATERAAISDA